MNDRAKPIRGFADFPGLTLSDIFVTPDVFDKGEPVKTKMSALQFLQGKHTIREQLYGW